MRALVTGSSGFIGSALLRALRAEGHTTHPVVRRAPGPGEVGIDDTSGRLVTDGLPGGDLGEVEVVFNLAGERLTPLRWGPAKLERVRASRIRTTDIVARAIASSPRAQRITLVSMSAVGYYGNRGDELLDEESSAGEGWLAELCRGWEAATQPANDAGGRVVRCRAGVVLGAGGGALGIEQRLFRLGLGGRLGDGSQWLSWIALDDAIAALLACANDARLTGAVNLSAPCAVRNAEFTETLGGVVHRATPFRVPRRALVLAAGRRTTDEFLLASQRVRPRRLEEAAFAFRFPELTPCLEAAMGASAGDR